MSTLKATNIQNPSSATTNVVLDTSGGATVGQNLAVTGTTTLTGAVTLTGGVASAGLPLKGSSSGTTTIVAAAAASGTVTIPAGTGTAAVQGVSTNIVSGTAQASTSGTTIDYTSLPSWVKRITVIFSGVSTNGTSNIIIQLGAGSLTTSGYISYTSYTGSSSGSQLNTTGFGNPGGGAGNVQYGQYVFTLLGSNTWVGTMMIGVNASGTAFTFWGGGQIALSGTLDRLRITTVNGTDTFDAGSINILYE